jgi:predicted GIY-YIG superfamily endonuclease
MPYREKNPCVYILASRRNGTLYIGVTSDLFQRVALHKQNLIEASPRNITYTGSSTTRRIRR